MIQVDAPTFGSSDTPDPRQTHARRVVPAAFGKHRRNGTKNTRQEQKRIALSPQPASPPARGLARRVFGVLTSPRATYADVAAHPRWFGVPLVVLGVQDRSALVAAVDGGRPARGDRSAVGRDGGVRVHGHRPAVPADGANGTILRVLRGCQPGYFSAARPLVIAGLAFAVFNARSGPRPTFKQVFAVVAHSSVVSSLPALVATPLDYAHESLSSPTNLARSSVLDDNSFVARLLGSIDLFFVWWMVSLAIGLGVLYKRRTAPIATACSSCTWRSRCRSPPSGRRCQEPR